MDFMILSEHRVFVRTVYDTWHNATREMHLAFILGGTNVVFLGRFFGDITSLGISCLCAVGPNPTLRQG